MNGPELLTNFRGQLIQLVAEQNELPASAPLSVSPWVATSLLQKSIRRSHVDLALRAAATLFQAAPDSLWRRLGCIAFEDIGVADLETVSLVTAALSGRRVRSSVGGEWAVANYLVQRMTEALKCRAADDLLLIAEQYPGYQRARNELAHESTLDLLRIATGSDPLPIKALALWYALGTDRRPSRHLQARRGEPASIFEHLCEAGFPHTTVEIAREGFRRTGEVLCPFVALLCPMRLKEKTDVADDPLPPEVVIDEVPGWAFDLYSRESRRSLQAFLEKDSTTARWIRFNIPGSQRVNFLGGLVFRVEGGLVRSRLRWPTADRLRQAVDLECHGPRCLDASDLLEQMRVDLPLLNEVRAHVR